MGLSKRRRAPPRRNRRLRRRLAVALGYEPGTAGAPEVLAKGAGFLAERILELAGRSKVPVRRDADLVEALSWLDVGAEIPPELYEAVAEVLAFVYAMNAQWRAAGEGGGRG